MVSYRRFGSLLELACLSHSNHVTVLQDGWQAVGLDRGWNLVAAKFNVPKHNRVQPGIFELKNTISCNGSEEVIENTLATGLIFASLSTVTAISVSLKGYISLQGLEGISIQDGK